MTTVQDLDLETSIRELVAAFPADGPGGVIAVARAGEVETLVPFGMANVEHAVPNTAETVFYLASTSKQFVAAAVAVLEADGVLDPDAPVAQWLPEVAQLGDIRVHHLVHHTSGIRDKYSLGALGNLPEEAYSTDSGTLAMLRRQRTLSFPPGERFDYSNSGYFLLAQLVERVSGQSLTDFTNERLFAPVGMTQTRFRADTGEVIAHRASGYAPDPASGGHKVSEYTWSSLGPGGVISTAGSLARWGLVWQGAALPGLADRLSAVRPLNDGRTGSYAYGVLLGEHAGQPMIRHSGGVFGFSAEMVQLPEEQLTVVALLNSGGGPVQQLADATLALLVPPGAPVAHSAPATSADDLVGLYVSPGEGSTAEVAWDGDNLIIEVGQVRAPLAPAGDGYALPNGMRVHRDGQTLIVGGSTTMPLRFEAVDGGEPTHTDVAGDYTSDELATTLTISRDGDGLQACWPDEAPTPLTHVAGDLYRVGLTLLGATALVRFLGDGTRADSLQLGMERGTGTILTRS
jgi:CubicO group peptidase (beta-lactamase class C family)